MFLFKNKKYLYFFILTLSLITRSSSLYNPSNLAPKSILKENTGSFSFSDTQIADFMQEGDFHKISFISNLVSRAEGTDSKNALKLSAWLKLQQANTGNNVSKAVMTANAIKELLPQIITDKGISQQVLQILDKAENLFEGEPSLWYSEFYSLLLLLKEKSINLDMRKFLKNYNSMLKSIEKRPHFRVFSSPVVWENIITHTNSYNLVFDTLQNFTKAVKKMSPEIASVLLDKSLLFEVARTGQDAPEKFETIFNHAYSSAKIKDKELRDKIYNRTLLFEANSNCLAFASSSNYYPYNEFNLFTVDMQKQAPYIKDVIDNEIIIAVAERYKGNAETVNRFLFNLYRNFANKKLDGAENFKALISKAILNSKDSNDCVAALTALNDIINKIGEGKYSRDILLNGTLNDILFNAEGYRKFPKIIAAWEKLQLKIAGNPKYIFLTDINILNEIVKFTHDRSDDVLLNIIHYLDKYPNLAVKFSTYLAIFSLYADFTDANISTLFSLWEETNIHENKFDVRDMYHLLEGNGYFTHTSVLNGMMPAEFVDADIAATNLKMIADLDALTAANNEAMKLIGGREVSRDVALEALANVRKMLDSYNAILLTIPQQLITTNYVNIGHIVRNKLKEVEDYFKETSTNDNILSDADVRKIRDITKDMSTVQDLIIALHQNSIAMLFDYYTGEQSKDLELEVTGAEIMFNEKIKVVDVLSQGPRERLSSAMLFIKDFFNHTDYIFGNDNLKNIVLGNKVYNFLQMRVHTAKIALDLTSPQVGGHLLFQYNENSEADKDGVELRQQIVAEVCSRMGMKVVKNGLNLNAIYNQECGASHVDELIDVYSKLWHINKILAICELPGAGKYDYFHYAALGREYRSKKDKNLAKNEIDEKVTAAIIDEYASLFMKNIAENFASASDIKNRAAKVFAGISGENFQEFLKEESMSGYETLTHVLDNQVLREDAYRNANMIEGIRDMVKWEKEALIGAGELVSANIELGYNHNMTLYALRDSTTSKLLLGWGVDNLTGKPIVDTKKLYQFVAEESYYPLNDYKRIPGKDILDELMPIFKDGFNTANDSTIRDKAKGLPVSEGEFEGEVVLYRRGEHKSSDLEGKVVVVDYLTPEDDTVVRTAGALVLLGGGNLSHGAIFAREMKIPAVILNNFTMSSKSFEGEIKILKPKNDFIEIASDDIETKRFEKETKMWSIDEGFVLKINGGEGFIRDIDSVKKDLIVLLRNAVLNKAKIKDLLKEHTSLIEFAYDKISLDVKAKELREELLAKYPKLKIYQEKSLTKKKSKVKEDVAKILDEMEAASHNWIFFSKLNDLRKLIEENKGDILIEHEISFIHNRIAEIANKNKKLVWDKQKEIPLVTEIDVDYMRLAEVDNSYMPVLGNKVAKLGEVYQAMENAGAEVPAGVGLTSKFFDDFMDISYQGRTLRDEIALIMRGRHSTSDKSQTIMDVIDEIKHTQEYAALKARADKIYKSEWGESNVQLAVRSSAIRKGKQLEDTVGTAGLYESYMFVDPSDMFERVVDVWSSLYAERALNYYDKIMEGGIDDSLVSELSMAVVVQEHINSDKSGVIFSVNPADGSKNTVISAGLGQGEGVVQGIIDVDTFVVTPNGLIEEKYISDKKDMMIKDKTNKELVKVNSYQHFKDILGEEASDKIKTILSDPVLTDKTVHKLAALAKYLEDYFGYPVDMEFAVKDGLVYLTQVRMITTMGVDEGKSFLKDILTETVSNDFYKLNNTKDVLIMAEEFSKYMKQNKAILDSLGIDTNAVLAKSVNVESYTQFSVESLEDTRAAFHSAA